MCKVVARNELESTTNFALGRLVCLDWTHALQLDLKLNG